MSLRKEPRCKKEVHKLEEEGGMNVRSLLKELAITLHPKFHKHKDDVQGKALVDRALRLLRPTSDIAEHAYAVKLRLRQSIFKDASSGSDGPSLVSAFEKECERLRLYSPHLLNPYLALMQPLSFSGTDISPISLANSIALLESQREGEDGGLGFNAPKVPEVVTKILDTSTFGTKTQDDASAKLEELGVWVSKDVERKLLIDLIYILQGINGKHIKYDPRTEGYYLDPYLQINTGVKDTVCCICELGWLYCRVSDYLKGIFSSDEQGQGAGGMRPIVQSLGLVAQAFGFGLQEELRDYYRLLAVLEQELRRLNSPSQNGGESSGLTLIRLRAWMQDPIERMCLMARMVDCAQPLSGGALASRLHSHALHGDASSRAMVRRIMMAVCTPFYAILQRWMLQGELNDPHDEFFIGMDRQAAMLHTWDGTYYLRPQMLPRFLDQATAERILLVGKSINFMKLCKQRLPKEEDRAERRNRGYRQINKSKSLAAYGRVVDAPTYHSSPQHDNSSSSSSSSSSDSSTSGRSSTPRTERRSLGGGAGIATVLTAEETFYDRRSEYEANRVRGVRTIRTIASPSQAASPSIAVGAAGTPTGNYVAGAKKQPQQIPLTLHGESRVEFQEQKIKKKQESDEGQQQAALEEELKGALQYGGEAALASTVTRILSSINARLMNLMYSRFHVKRHLLALKKFLLLGQGDFVTCLMDGIGPELKKRALQLYRHNLTGLLEGALRSSNAQFEGAEVLDRVSVRLLEANPGDTGWEVFSLDYTVDAPLNAIIDAKAMGQYRVAFHMLWRLKRVEWSLSNAWKSLNTFTHASKNDTVHSLRNIFHRCTLARGRMMHVVNNLCGFIMFEVLETAWQMLEENIAKARSLDDVIEAHSEYLSEILDKSFLTPAHEALHMQVQQVQQIILRFCSLEETLIADAMASVARRRMARNMADERSTSMNMSQSRAFGPPVDDELEGPYGGIPDYVIQRLDEAALDYGKQVDALMKLLSEEGDKAGRVLRYLTFRLDFNEYESRSSLQEHESRGAGILGPTAGKGNTSVHTTLLSSATNKVY